MASRYSLQHPHLHLRRGPSVHHSPQPRRLGRDGDVLLRRGNRKIIQHHQQHHPHHHIDQIFVQTTLLFFLLQAIYHTNLAHTHTHTFSHQPIAISIAIEQQQQQQELQRIWINLTNLLIFACLFYIFLS